MPVDERVGENDRQSLEERARNGLSLCGFTSAIHGNKGHNRWAKKASHFPCHTDMPM